MTANGDNQEIFEFGGFRLSRTVLEFRGSLVALTPKAIDTLYLLVAREPEVVTKDEIMQAVWPDTFVVESSLARNISLIRKELDELAGAGTWIETIPKRGYRFNPPAAQTMPIPAPLPDEPAPEPIAAPQTDHPLTAPSAQTEVGSPYLRPTLFAAFGLAVLGGAAALFWSPRSEVPQPPADPAALIGDHLLAKGTPSEIHRATTLFERETAARPESASAHAGLAIAYVVRRCLAAGDTGDIVRARTEAETAYRLNPNLPAANTALGLARLAADLDVPGAEALLRRGVALDPKSVIARYTVAFYYRSTGNMEEALKASLQSERLDPVTPLVGASVGMDYYFKRDFEQARRQFDAVLDRERNYNMAHYYLALTLGHLGRHDEALEHLAKAELHPGVLGTDRAWLALMRGDRGPAEANYAAIRKGIQAGGVSPHSILLPAILVDRIDEAIVAMEGVMEARGPETLTLLVDPRLEPARKHPRFAAIREKLSGRTPPR